MKATGNFFTYAGQSANHLNKLNFSLTLSNSAWEKKVAPLIATFANVHPRDVIPRGAGGWFTIPSEEPWPENVWGVNLGIVVQWNLNRLETIERDWKNQVLQANEVFQYENGNKVMRDKFVVPSRSPWPYKTWGRELRHILTCVQIGQHYGGHIALANFHSNEACAVASPQNEQQWKTVIMPALHMFATVFGHCAVKEDFEVPSLSPWPKSTFGLKLGSIVAALEKRGAYFAEVGLNADRLETFGFRYKLEDAPWQEHVTPLLSIFASQFPHEVIPEDFVVPPKEPWPQQLYGLRLGKIVTWSSRFVWNENYSGQWKERGMPENTSLAGAYGYCCVPSSFRVPSELPWPKQMWGLRMKLYLRQLHRSGDLFIPGGLHRAMMSERKFGFVFKLATDVSCGEREEYRADVEQIGEGIGDEQHEGEPKSCLGKRQLPDAFSRKLEGWVGSYSPKSRKARVERFLKKRQERVWVREVKYDVRKSFADTRLRVKGRFVTREDEKTMRELLSFT
ncbi:B-BOX TYPE ZINC FINGER-CONTAINING PROTEIN-RELATED [Phytophthora cinnamomi]|uniref:B-BOX TYPE ZINC FINGER-CONTAINING PROTEIN-RELATED n=1 Tax=Phytophthora cinnamomi TaxID=4785 RepID=UPI00355ACD0E|nr:B-BOX TYPE ZINC FINGER-CONTAINING PROTEIN-RELATED [Phytophthora cinnamomi]